MAIGNDYIKNLLAQINQEESVQAQPQSEPVVDPIEEVRIKLAEAGYDTDDNNVNTFIEHNPDGALNRMSSVRAQYEPKKLDGVGSFVKGAIASVPFMQVLGSMLGPLEVLGEGFKRYEAARAGMFLAPINGKPTFNADILAGATGAAKTKFPDAELRMGDYPEFGDLFRAMHLPEGVSATAGLISEMLSDPLAYAGGVLLKGAVAAGKPFIKSAIKGTELESKFINPMIKGYKLASGKVSEAGDTLLKSKYASTLRGHVGETTADIGKKIDDKVANLYDTIKEKMLNLRSNEHVKYVYDMALGKGKYSYFTKPLRDVFKGFDNQEALFHTNITEYMTQIAKHANRDETVLKNVSEAIRGDARAFDNLPPIVKTEVNKVVSSLADEERTLAELADKLDAKMGLPKADNPNIIKENAGKYITRKYTITEDNPNWKFKQDKFDDAVNELVLSEEQGLKSIKTEEQAKAYLRDFMAKAKAGHAAAGQGGSAAKLDPHVFKHRTPFGPAVRDFLGEIVDPFQNIRTTAQKVAQAKHSLNVLDSLIDSGLIQKHSDDLHPVPIPNDSRLFLGKAGGWFGSKDMAGFLHGLSMQENWLDIKAKQAMQWLKFSKTVLNLKTQVHNPIGNLFNATIKGVAPWDIPNEFKQALSIYRDVRKWRKGSLPGDNPNILMWKKAIGDGWIGSEMPSNEQLIAIDKFVASSMSSRGLTHFAQEGLKEAMDTYAFSDQLFKLAQGLHLEKQGLKVAGKKGVPPVFKKLRPDEITDEIYSTYADYRQLAHAANDVRTSAAGLFFMNPFFSFQSEQHRLMLGFLKNPETAWKFAALMGSRLAYNTSILAMHGQGLQDIWEYIQTDPKIMSEYLLNPLNKDTGLNLKYMDPFNAGGLFAPLLAASGATGVNPLDYLMDMTAFSDDFGYSNLLLNSLKPALSAQGRFGEPLTGAQRVGEVIKGITPGSFSNDLPKAVDPNRTAQERLISTFRMFGIDLESRSPDYVKRKFSKRLKENIAEGRNIDSTTKIAEMLGFDGERMAKTALTNAKKTKKPEQKKVSPHEALFKQLGI